MKHYLIIAKTKPGHESAAGFIIDEKYNTIKSFKNVYGILDYIPSVYKAITKYNIDDNSKILCGTLEDGIKIIEQIVKFEEMKKTGKITSLNNDDIDAIIEMVKNELL